MAKRDKRTSTAPRRHKVNRSEQQRAADLARFQSSVAARVEYSREVVQQRQIVEQHALAVRDNVQRLRTYNLRRSLKAQGLIKEAK